MVQYTVAFPFLFPFEFFPPFFVRLQIYRLRSFICANTLDLYRFNIWYSTSNDCHAINVDILTSCLYFSSISFIIFYFVVVVVVVSLYICDFFMHFCIILNDSTFWFTQLILDSFSIAKPILYINIYSLTHSLKYLTFGIVTFFSSFH